MGRYVLPAKSLFVSPVDLKKRYGENYDPNVFKRWERDERLVKLRNGLYRNTTFPFNGDYDRYVAAARMYEPSYISLTSAFRNYNFIPETVYETTSVTTRKTKVFENAYGRFSYQTMKRELLWGFSVVAWNGGYCRLAHPEKCLLDAFYLDPRYSDRGWVKEMRFDGVEVLAQVDLKRLSFYVHIFKSRVVTDRTELFLDTLEL